jgi:hypothetical protein
MNQASEARKNFTNFIGEFEWTFNITLLQRRGAACTAPRKLNLLLRGIIHHFKTSP